MKPKTHNTHQRGVVTVFLYRKGKKYLGVCLELDIVDEDSDRIALMVRMREMVQSYVEYVCSRHLDESLLNRPAPAKYWKMFFKHLYSLQELEKKYPFRVFPQAEEASIETLPLLAIA